MVDGDWVGFQRFGGLQKGLSLVGGCLVHCVHGKWQCGLFFEVGGRERHYL